MAELPLNLESSELDVAHSYIAAAWINLKRSSHTIYLSCCFAVTVSSENQLYHLRMFRLYYEYIKVI